MEECLGETCRFYVMKPDNICFKQGVLPRCSPELKASRRKLNHAAPDLYEALKAAQARLQDYQDVTEGYRLERQMQSALAKAETL